MISRRQFLQHSSLVSLSPIRAVHAEPGSSGRVPLIRTSAYWSSFNWMAATMGSIRSCRTQTMAMPGPA